MGPLLAANQGAHWEVVYDAPQRDVVRPCSRPSGEHTVLASFTIDDSTSAILNTTVTLEAGAAAADRDQAVQLARRSGALRDWIAQYPGVDATATLGDDRVWTVPSTTATAARWRRPASTTRR